MPTGLIQCPLVTLPSWLGQVTAANRDHVAEEITRICRRSLRVTLLEELWPADFEFTFDEAYAPGSAVLVELDDEWPEDWIDDNWGLPAVPVAGQMMSNDDFAEFVRETWGAIVRETLKDPPPEVFD